MRIIAIVLSLWTSGAMACDGLHLSIGAGYDAHQTFNKTMSDFRLEWVKDWFYVGYGRHSTYQTGAPFNDQKDKNTTDYVSAGIRIKLW